MSRYNRYMSAELNIFKLGYKGANKLKTRNNNTHYPCIRNCNLNL